MFTYLRAVYVIIWILLKRAFSLAPLAPLAPLRVKRVVEEERKKGCGHIHIITTVMGHRCRDNLRSHYFYVYLSYRIKVILLEINRVSLLKIIINIYVYVMCSRLKCFTYLSKDIFPRLPGFFWYPYMHCTSSCLISFFLQSQKKCRTNTIINNNILKVMRYVT